MQMRRVQSINANKNKNKIINIMKKRSKAAQFGSSEKNMRISTKKIIRKIRVKSLMFMNNKTNKNVDLKAFFFFKCSN